MITQPAVVVHGLADARAALRPGYPVTLLSAPGAARFAGCLWWRELVAAARAEQPATPVRDVLDCGDAPGLAMAAQRVGQRRLVLAAGPAFAAVAMAADGLGAVVLAERPPALDLARRGNLRRLRAWLGGDSGRAAALPTQVVRTNPDGT
jgi:hypothetical protein